MFGKIVGENIEFAPNIINRGNKQIINPHDDVLKAKGYKEVVFTDYPNDGKYYVSSYKETDTQIVQEWAETEPPADEATAEDYENALKEVGVL